MSDWPNLGHMGISEPTMVARMWGVLVGQLWSVSESSNGGVSPTQRIGLGPLREQENGR